MNEQISALADGEISAEDLAHEISLLLSDKKAMQAWCDYQMMGDVMRSQASTKLTVNLSANFTQNLMQKLDLEPTVLAPNAIVQKVKNTKIVSQIIPKKSERLPAAWSIAASCAAVLMVGWMLLNQQLSDFTSPLGTQLATLTPNQQKTNKAESTTPTAVNAANAPAASLEYLTAHQVSAPSVGSYYVQPASYIQPASYSE